MVRTKYKILQEGLFYVYGLYRPDKEEQLFYIGKGQGDRINNHTNEARLLQGSHKKRSLKVQIIHYLWRMKLDFEGKILYNNLSEKDAYRIEKSLIKGYGRIDLKTGYLANLTEGGDGPAGRIPWNKNVPRTENVKQKLRIANLNKRYTKEVNLSKGRKGRVSNRKGIKMSEEQKRKTRKAMRRYYQTQAGLQKRQRESERMILWNKRKLAC